MTCPVHAVQLHWIPVVAGIWKGVCSIAVVLLQCLIIERSCHDESGRRLVHTVYNCSLALQNCSFSMLQCHTQLEHNSRCSSFRQVYTPFKAANSMSVSCTLSSYSQTFSSQQADLQMCKTIPKFACRECCCKPSHVLYQALPSRDLETCGMASKQSTGTAKIQNVFDCPKHYKPSKRLMSVVL